MPLPTDDYIDQTAQEYALDPQYLRRYMNIESSGNPNATTGSYKGLFQLSEPEFKRWGGTGNIYDPVANTKAAATKFRAETNHFNEKYGRQPSPTELYLIHQQGEGGFDAHLNNPNQPAWKSMLSTGEGQQKGEAWAKKAIWGNIPNDIKRQYGSVDNITSQDFMNIWKNKVEGPLGSVQTAQANNNLTPASQAIVDSWNKPKGNAKQTIVNLFNKPIINYDFALALEAQNRYKLTPIVGNPFEET